MHILIASVSSATSPTGVCRHAANVARGLLSRPEVSKVTLCIGSWQEVYFKESFGLGDPRLTIRPVHISNSSLARNLWYLKGLPYIARRSRADIVHLAYPAPVLRHLMAAPVVVSLHDLYPYDIPENFAGHAFLNRLALKFCLRNAHAIAAVSVQTRDKLHQRFLYLSPFRTVVIPNSVHIESASLAVPLPKEVRNAPFVLCVAQHRMNKNLSRLLRGFHHALMGSMLPVGANLVIVGREGPETRKISQQAHTLGLSDRLVLLSGITDGLLASLYKHCLVVAAPSLIEGFGLPVAEALSFGCRVAASDIEAFRNSDDGSCSWFDPHEETGRAFAGALAQALSSRNNHTMEHHLRPEECAAQYICLYRDLLKGGELADNYAFVLQPDAITQLLMQNNTSTGDRSR